LRRQLRHQELQEIGLAESLLRELSGQRLGRTISADGPGC